MSRKILITSVLMVLAGAAIAALLARGTTEQARYPDLIDDGYLSALPAEDRSGIDTSHVHSGLTPPTNKWFSGLALQQTPQAVFPMPLSFRPTEKSFEIGLPEVTATSEVIFGPHASIIEAVVKGAASYQVVRYDELSVDLEFAGQDKKIGIATIAAGSPYIFFTAVEDAVLLIDYDGIASTKPGAAAIELDGKTLAVSCFNGATLTDENGRLSASIPKDGHVTFYAPSSGSEKLVNEHAGNRLTGAEVSYAKKDGTYQTTINVNTVNDRPTVLGFLPHHNPLARLSESAYQTILGQMTVAAGNEFTFSTPEIPIRLGLSLKNISKQDKDLLVEMLKRDIGQTRFAETDTYFGGKALYRAAQLLDLARQLGQDQLAASAQEKLAAEFDAWFSADSHLGKYFYYDSRMKGIVGHPPAFGSEIFNDHHFHYGYFIYAASILAKYDKAFQKRHISSVNLLVADIANYRNDPELPLRRHFDPYFGHSWASGSAPFSDGNNQESSSEAINAWTSIGLWARQTGNTRLQEQAAWMLSNEAAAANAYWLHFDGQAQPYSDGYSQPIIALNWGGKREYATFFSQEPNAMLGIQLIPMNPTMSQQNAADERIRQNVRATQKQSAYDHQFGDYILMYEALAGDPRKLLDIASSLPDEYIDGANSRSYLYAWLMAASHQ